MEIRGSLRYLYEDSKVTATELLQKAHAVEAEFAGGNHQLKGKNAKNADMADQPGKATSVVVQHSKISTKECKPWSADISKMTAMIKSLATSVDKIHKKVVKNVLQCALCIPQTAEVVAPPAAGTNTCVRSTATATTTTAVVETQGRWFKTQGV